MKQDARVLIQRDADRDAGDQLAKAMVACAKDPSLLLWPAVAAYMQRTGWLGPACQWVKATYHEHS